MEKIKQLKHKMRKDVYESAKTSWFPGYEKEIAIEKAKAS
jgi:hypothetical protein